MFSYSHLLYSSNQCMRDEISPYTCLTERHLQAIWLEQKYFRKPLKVQGKNLEVLSPGIWNTETGPDFLKAHIRIGQQELKGDIDIHLSEENWYQYEHQEDRRYNQVILHVAFWQPRTAKPIMTQEGREVPTVYLEHIMTVPLSRLIKLVDLDLYPYKKFWGSGRCAQHLFKTLPVQEVSNFLTSASYWRLEQKFRYLQEHISEPSLQLPAGIAMGLGYKHNAEAFLELFLFLLDFRDLPFNELLAIALGCCGFFEHKRYQWETSIYYQELRILWQGQQHHILHQAQLRLDRIRPFNHPARRLAYLAKLLQDPLLETKYEELLELWEQYSKEWTNPRAIQLFKQRLIAAIPTYEDHYWNSHYTFEESARSGFLSLIGEDLKEEILINTYLPLLYGCMKRQRRSDDLEAFQALYQIFRCSHSSKSHYLLHRFFGDKREAMNTAQLEQGAYQLHKDFCIFYEASCEGCPFVERYLSLSSLVN